MALLSLMPSVILILFAIGLNEIMKMASQPRVGGDFHCQVCGRSMRPVQSHWAYRHPFEVWVITSRYNLPPSTVQRYLCPEKHTQAWYVPNLGDRKGSVLVTRNLQEG